MDIKIFIQQKKVPIPICKYSRRVVRYKIEFLHDFLKFQSFTLNESNRKNVSLLNLTVDWQNPRYIPLIQTAWNNFLQE
jgi:hypothetical protein